MTSWRGHLARIKDAGGEILACSVDSVPTLQVFSATLNVLPFPVASDWMREVSRAYGVYHESGGYSLRSVFVIRPDGTVAYENRAFSARDAQHYEEALAALEASAG